jgi:hypothetical protein
MSEYDSRQYNLMLGQLRDFNSKRIDLKHLIHGLETLLGCLENPAADWKLTFQKHWGVLEDVYADALDRKDMELPEAHKKLIEDATSTLQTMVEDALR